MAKFKQVSQTFLPRKLGEFWGNMVKNYSGNVMDDDFFKILHLCCNHEKAIELIECAYTDEELKAMCGRRFLRDRTSLDVDLSLKRIFNTLWNKEKSHQKCRLVINALLEQMVSSYKRKRKEEILESRFNELARLLKLEELERQILILVYVIAETSFTWPYRIHDREKILYYAMALDRGYEEVARAMSSSGKLRKFGLLDDDWDFEHRIYGFIDGSVEDALCRRFYGKKNCDDALPWDYYGDLAAKDGAVICEMMKASTGKCNILFYGAPGTGKTSFARTLAKRLGRTAFEIRQGADDGQDMNSQSRMVGIQICNEQEDAETGLMIVDEADELLRGRSCGFGFFGMEFAGKSTEKGVMNSILDEMKLPAIWISNAPAEYMDESVRRRFDYSICFERMSVYQREFIWRNVVAKNALGDLIGEEQIGRFAAKYETSAGGISTVLSNVKRMKPTADKVDELVATLMKPHCRLMGVAETDKFLPAKGYSLDGLNVKGDVRLEKVVKAVRNYMDESFNEAGEDKPRMNILMFGPPGTGKTEFVKYLGKELDRKVLVMRGSDILSPYVGLSEQNISSAFRLAEQDRAILFFDEIDGLVQNRAGARASWQVTQVNELLQQMENFKGVMVAATNFCRNLDPAIMRRFTFKFEFDYLGDEGKRRFFERMFKTTLTETEFADLKSIECLTPGDFRTVRQKQFYLDDTPSNADRIAALREECALKNEEGASARIGFPG